MKITKPSRPAEQRKVEKLLAKLKKLKPIAAKPAQVLNETRILRSA
jgi:hypothetical protein